MNGGYFRGDIEQLKRKGSFQRKLGVKIAKCGITPVPIILIKYFKKIGLKYSDFYLIIYILSKKRDIEWPYFSLNKITRDMGICQDTLHKIKRRLIKKCFLMIYPKKENPRGKGRSVYDLSGLFILLNIIVEKDHKRLFKVEKWSQDDFSEYLSLDSMEKMILSEK